MQTSRTFRLATVLFVLGLVPEIAGACVGVYTDFSIDAEESELTAWGAVADSYNGGYCFATAYSQWGYWEHTYEASVDIESPTMNTASDSDTWPDIPYGGWAANASATISFDDDPGQYIIIWALRIYCTVGGWFVDYFFEDFPTIAPVDIRRYQHPTNSSDKADLELSEAIDILFDANALLWSDEGADDVSCRLLLVPWPPTIGTFGPFGNGDGIIDDEAEEDEVFAYSWLVSVVKEIHYCDGFAGPSSVWFGCAGEDEGIIVDRLSSLEGILWAHEYGHHKGLWYPHDTSDESLGYDSLESTMTRVTQTECDVLRSP